MVCMVRTSKDKIAQPRYTFDRNYRGVDRGAMAWDLVSDTSLWEARTERDSDRVTELIQEGISRVLEAHAPRKVIQMKNKLTINVKRNKGNPMKHLKRPKLTTKTLLTEHLKGESAGK